MVIVVVRSEELPSLDEVDTLADAIATSASTVDATLHTLLSKIRRFGAIKGWARQGAKTCTHWLVFRALDEARRDAQKKTEVEQTRAGGRVLAAETFLANGPRVLDVGRKRRTAPSSLFRVLRIRDGGCRFPGCTHQAFVEAHHIEHWAHGGKTNLENTVLLCSAHHRAVHEEGFQIHSTTFPSRITNLPKWTGEKLDRPSAVQGLVVRAGVHRIEH